MAGLAVGAGAGALTAKIVDLGISDEWETWFRSSLSVRHLERLYAHLLVPGAKNGGPRCQRLSKSLFWTFG